MATLLTKPKIRFFNNAGAVLSLGKVYTLEAGTVVLKTTWKNQDKSTPNTNPIILDAFGRADIWGDGSYKIDLYDADDNQIPGWPIDDINLYDPVDWTGLTATIADLNSTTTTGLQKNSDYNIVLTDRGKTLLVDTTSGDKTINLLALATATNRYRITIKKIDKSNNKVVIEPSGAEQIDGKDNADLYDYGDFVEILDDGSQWRTVASKIRGTILLTSIAATMTLDDHDRVYLCDATGGAFNLNLLATTDVGRGFLLTVKKNDSSTNIITVTPSGGDTIDSASNLELKNQYETVSFKSDGAGNWVIISEFDTDDSTGYMRNFISGMLIKSNAVTPDTQIDISVGKCRDSQDSANMRLAAPMTKLINASWSQGTGNGGYPKPPFAPVAPITWYHIFVIAKDDGTTDAGFDTDIAAVNLLSTAGVDWTKYRRIGSIYTDTAASTKTIVPLSSISNINGARKFYFTAVELNGTSDNTWATPDYNANPAEAVEILITLTHCPLGISTFPIMQIQYETTTGLPPGTPHAIYFHSADFTLITTGFDPTVIPYGQLGSFSNQLGGGRGTISDVQTNITNQLYLMKKNIAHIKIGVVGWYDLLELA